MGGVRRVAAIALLLVATGVAACGGAEEKQAASPREPAAARPADFPSATGRTLKALARGLPEGPILAPSTSQLLVGNNRFGFALLDTARKQVEASAVAVYTSRTDGTALRGPYPARRESMAVKAPYRSPQAAADLANGDTIYVADLPFERPGGRVVTALARMDGRLVAASRYELVVDEGGDPPAIGEKAVSVHTLTQRDLGGNRSSFDTDVPPDAELHQDDLAEVLGKKPVVLLFAGSQPCASPVCGPVTDIAEQVKAEAGDGVAFIHQEIYVDNDVSKGQRPQVRRYRLPTEPWTFVIDRRGIVRDRFEGAFSADELTRAVEKVKAQ